MQLGHFDRKQDDFLSSLTDEEIEKIPDLHTQMLKYIIKMKVPIFALLISMLFIVGFIMFVQYVLT
jgi:hypothetical protein